MIIQLLGYRKVEYTSKSGNDVKGVECHMMQLDSADSNFSGNPLLIQYIGGLDSSSLVVGDCYEVRMDVAMFNGKPQVRFVGLTPYEGKLN
jgi:hypothetical protein